jgi:predicted NAD/FAD-binding protein
MRIAILGAGGAGLASAFVLQHDHEVTVYEREPEIGGHARSVPVPVGDRVVYAETGFKFFFDPIYPSLLGLLRLIGVRPVKHLASSSITRGADAPMVLPPRSARGVLRLASSPSTVRELYWLRRMLQSAETLVSAEDWRLTLREHLDEIEMPRAVQENLVLPMLAAHWGAPARQMPCFPAYSVLKVLRREDLDRPHLYEIEEGVSTYIRAVARRLTRAKLWTDRGVVSVRRVGAEWHVADARGESHAYDHVVLAGSSRDALELVGGLAEAAPLAEVLGRFKHFDTTIAVHRDPSFMPPRRENWALINVFLERGDTWQTEWSGWRTSDNVFRTWLPRDGRMPSDPLLVRKYHHLVVTPENRHLQARLATLQGWNGLSCVGMYTTDVDNHESALRSALALGRRLAPGSPDLAAWEREIARSPRIAASRAASRPVPSRVAV